jgi:hypothetical protein
MSPIGNTKIAFGSFVKFGGGMAKHHGNSMIDEYISIGITQVTLKGTHLPIHELDSDPPLYRVDDAISYIVQWPWKETIAYN